VQDHIVRGHHVAASVGDALDRRLERGILEGLDLPAVVAHEVVVMVAAGVRGLEACEAVAEVDALDEPERVHALECAVDAREADAHPASSRLLVDLVCREATVLLAEQFDDDPASPAAAPACIS
jgi:hypothetical protein